MQFSFSEEYQLKILGEVDQELLSGESSITVNMNSFSIFVVHSDMRQESMNLTIKFKVFIFHDVFFKDLEVQIYLNHRLLT